MIPALLTSFAALFSATDAASSHSLLLVGHPSATHELSLTDGTLKSGRKSSFSSYYDEPAQDQATGRWIGSHRQFGYGILGTLAGTGFGALVGYGVGYGVGSLFLPDRPDRPYSEPMYRINTVDRAALAGMAVGSAFGLVSGTGFLVSEYAQPDYASRGWGVATLGATAGLGTAIGLLTTILVVAPDGTHDETGDVVLTIFAWSAMLGGPSLGSVIADRLWAHSPVNLTLEPMILRSNRNGACLSLRF